MGGWSPHRSGRFNRVPVVPLARAPFGGMVLLVVISVYNPQRHQSLFFNHGIRLPVAGVDRVGIWCGRYHRSVDTVVEETYCLPAMWGTVEKNRWDVGV